MPLIQPWCNAALQVSCIMNIKQFIRPTTLTWKILNCDVTYLGSSDTDNDNHKYINVIIRIAHASSCKIFPEQGTKDVQMLPYIRD